MKKIHALGFLSFCTILSLTVYTFLYTERSTMNEFQILSPAFIHNSVIPSGFTCKGENVSPPLEWKHAPQEAKSFVLIVDDPDAPHGIWVHWVVYNLPSYITLLPEAVIIESLGGLEGVNSSGKNRYDGPCPPSGTHRYLFNLYAVDTILDLGSGATKETVLKALDGHILAQTQLIGLSTH